jgi:hypothetical protein
MTRAVADPDPTDAYRAVENLLDVMAGLRIGSIMAYAWSVIRPDDLPPYISEGDVEFLVGSEWRVYADELCEAGLWFPVDGDPEGRGAVRYRGFIAAWPRDSATSEAER